MAALLLQKCRSRIQPNILFLFSVEASTATAFDFLFFRRKTFSYKTEQWVTVILNLLDSFVADFVLYNFSEKEMYILSF